VSDVVDSAPEVRAVEDWARSKSVDPKRWRAELDHWFCAAKCAERWGVGREMSEAEYDAAIARVQSITLR
jgi:hypothetical protein